MARRRVVDDRKRICAKPQREQKSVKSAERVLEIFEYFDDLQRQATVMEIAEALGYPQSSTSALLRTLVSLGYLNFDPRSRSYVTSSRVALLGSWVNSSFFAEGAIISLMRELNEVSGDAILLATRQRLAMQYIHVLQATSPARLHISLGTVRPLAASGSGYALLASMSDAEVTRLVMRINAEAEEGSPLVKIRDLLAELAQIRERGYAFTCDLVTPGGGIIATTLPRVAGQPLMVIGIAGISEVLRRRERELAGLLKTQIEKRFDLRGGASGYREAGAAPARATRLRRA